MRYAFTNADNIVVQIIVGTLNPDQQAQFLRDYAVVFGATSIIEVNDETMVAIGYRYTDGVFTPVPEPQPEPQPEPEPEPEI